MVVGPSMSLAGYRTVGIVALETSTSMYYGVVNYFINTVICHVSVSCD